MDVCALVPFRPENRERERNWECTRLQWLRLGWKAYVGDHEGQPFSRARAINNAAKQAGDVDVFCIADVDFLFGGDQAEEAAETAFKECAHVVPFSALHILDRESTKKVRDGQNPNTVSILESVGLVWVCAAMISKELFDLVGGFDGRFIGYGEEDLAFVASTGTMGKKLRVNGVAYHLNHKEPDKEHSYRGANRNLCSRYRAADGDKEAMMEIISERYDKI